MRIDFALGAILLPFPWCCAAEAFSKPTRGSLLGSLERFPFVATSMRGGDSDHGGTGTQRRFRCLQVQVIHRHGDRTPITTMKDAEYWASTLVEPSLLDKIAMGTTLRREGQDHTAALSHNAQGKGPFGKLTMMGLLQMVDVGTDLRNQLEYDGQDDDDDDEDEAPMYCETIGDGHPHCPYVCSKKSRPFSAENLKVVSTDFERTIQSVRAVIVGMFPDGLGEGVDLDIDCRHTQWMIPDPQPRSTKEQELLEVALSRQPHILEREELMKPLAVRATKEILNQLDESAFHMSYGVGEDEEEDDKEDVLPWSQLSEVTKCLKVRGLLPDSISDQDQEAIISHAAWRWFESMKDPRLCYLAMHRFCQNLVDTMQQYKNSPPVILYSAHDSTLIGTLCSLRLEQPSVWPPYASYLKIELIQDERDGKLYVRFVFNGKVLSSRWREESLDLISLDELAEYVATEGAEPSEFADEK